MKENKYCAFFRGVNIKGTNMKMKEVCEVFANAGMKNVTSVLASGNIIFTSEKKAEELKLILEKIISKAFNYEAFIFIKTEHEVTEILKSNPFEALENYHNYIFVTIPGTEIILMDEFKKSKKTENEDAKIINNIFYWKVSKGLTLESEFGKILGKKNLKDKFTSRNINTFEKIVNKF